MGIGNRLSVLLEKRDTNPNELAKRVGVSPQTIYSIIKRDSKKADIEVLLKIADILGVSVEYFIDDAATSESSKSDVLSPSDMSLLKKYHDLDDHGREMVDLVLEKETERCENSMPAAVVEFSSGATPKRLFPYYGKIASAGKGFEFADIVNSSGTVEYPVTDMNSCADYTIGVSGDSMEPTYYDGDIVFVKRVHSLSLGEIGIFQKDNEILIKEVGDGELVSHKKGYAPIPNNDDIRCLGKVLGKYEE